MKGRLNEAEMARAHAFIVVLFLRFIWAGIGNLFLIAISAVGRITVLFRTKHENGG